MQDQTVCRMHGGMQPAAIVNAEKRRNARQAILAAEAFGLPREVDPHTALLEELYRTAGAVEWLSAVVADLERDAITWGMTREKEGGEDAGTTHEAKVSVWVQLWQAERKHLIDVGKACVGAGIEERRVRLAEQAGAVLAGVLQRFAAAMLLVVAEAVGPSAALDAVRAVWAAQVSEIGRRELMAAAETPPNVP